MPHNIDPEDIRHYKKLIDALSKENGCLLYGARLVILDKLRSKVLELVHLGLFGIQQVKQLARSGIILTKILNTCAEHVMLVQSTRINHQSQRIIRGCTRWFRNLPKHFIWNTVIISRNIFSLSPHTLDHSYISPSRNCTLYLSTTHISQRVTDRYSHSYGVELESIVTVSQQLYKWRLVNRHNPLKQFTLSVVGDLGL